jgi:hypothetical protein
MTTLSFDQGMLLLDGLDQPVGQAAHMTPPGFILDERVGAWRSEVYLILAVSKRLALSEAAAKELDVLWFAGKLSTSAVIERADILVKDD